MQKGLTETPISRRDSLKLAGFCASAVSSSATALPAIDDPLARASAQDPLSRMEVLEIVQWISNACLTRKAALGGGLELIEGGAIFDRSSARLEGVARLLWGLVPAARGGAPLPEMAAICDMIAEGVSPEHPAYWGPAGDFVDQRAVEMASIAVALRDAPDAIRSNLSVTAYENLLNWLESVNATVMPENNWRWFRILTLEALAAHGRLIDRSVIEREFALLDGLRLERGWYRDGAGGGVDWYNGFAFHFYGLLWARWRQSEEPDRAATIISSAHAFADDFIYWFGQDGSPIAYGRSQIYRCAGLGFWGLLAEIGHPRISIARIRKLWDQSLRWWLRQPIWLSPGIPSIGYAYANLLVQEFYNSPQSPLWMMKAFTPLALPASHPFWTAIPDATVAEDKTLILTSAPYILRRQNGSACLLPGSMPNSEHRGYEDKYGKFAYSSSHGFAVEGARWLVRGLAGDNLVAVSADGVDWWTRRTINDARIVDDWLITRWTTPHAQIETRQRFVERGEERHHVIAAKETVSVVTTGHAVDRFSPNVGIPEILRTNSLAPLPIRGRTRWSNIVSHGDLRGFRTNLPVAPNTHLIFPESSVPALVYRIPPGDHFIENVLEWGNELI